MNLIEFPVEESKYISGIAEFSDQRSYLLAYYFDLTPQKIYEHYVSLVERKDLPKDNAPFVEGKEFSDLERFASGAIIAFELRRNSRLKLPVYSVGGVEKNDSVYADIILESNNFENYESIGRICVDTMRDIIDKKSCSMSVRESYAQLFAACVDLQKPL